MLLHSPMTARLVYDSHQARGVCQPQCFSARKSGQWSCPSLLQEGFSISTKLSLAFVVLLPPQSAVFNVIKVDGGVTGLYKSPDAPVLVCHQRKGIGFHHCFFNICLALHHKELPSGTCQKASKQSPHSPQFPGLIEQQNGAAQRQARQECHHKPLECIAKPDWLCSC